MKKKKRIVLFALTTTLLLSGCTLSKEQVPEQVIEPIITVKEENTIIGGISISKSVVKAPSTASEQEEIIAYIESLEGNNQVVIYHADSANTKKESSIENITQDQTYSKEIFEASLKERPMVQIYYCGSERKEEKEIALYYPNVTYVGKDKKVENVIATYYRANYITGSCIHGLRSGVKAVEDFDLEGTIESAKSHLPDIDKEEVIDGLTAFSDYVENTTLFKKAEKLTDKVEDALRPYVEATIPALENAWDSAKPYLEKGKDKMAEIYEDVKPKFEDTYEDTKEYIKSILGK